MIRWIRLYAVFCLCIAPLAHAQSVRTHIPPRAFEHLPTLKAEQQRILPGFEHPEYFGGLIEHESCISLTHSRCWSPTSRLKTAREEGAGLPQLTRAYHADGKLRFDALTDLKRQHAQELRELSWQTVYQRPDLQIRAMLLMSRQNLRAVIQVKDLWERLAMMDAAYNGGLGGLLKERRECGLRANCDASKWFGHVENTCLKSKRVLYAGRNACDINRHHVVDVLKVRMPKYRPHLTDPS